MTIEIRGDFALKRSFRAEPLRGRGACVFEVFEMNKDGNKTGSAVVLKDNLDRSRLHDRAQFLPNCTPRPTMKVEKYFLAIICHGDVWMQPCALDDTECGLICGLKFTLGSAFKLQRNWFLRKNQLPLGRKGFGKSVAFLSLIQT